MSDGNRNILLVGSSGYIGRHVFAAFSSTFKVVKSVSRAGDLRLNELQNIDVVINAAGLAHSSATQPTEYAKVNAIFPCELARAARDAGVKKFIHLSSIAVYGSNINRIDESTPEAPDSPYGISKLDGDLALLSLQSDAFDVVILRPPMIYGPNAPGNPARLQRLAKLLPVLPLGGITNRRSFLSVNNLVTFVERALTASVHGVLLVADDDSVSTTKFVRHVARMHDQTVLLVNISFFFLILSVLLPTVAAKLLSDLVVSNMSTKQLIHIECDLPFG